MRSKGRFAKFFAAPRALSLAAAVLLPALLPGLCDGASFSREAAGTSSGEFLTIAVSARCAAMGEACSALANDASALYWNPAGLMDVAGRSLVFMHAPYLADTVFDYAAYAQNVPDVGSWGVSVQYMNMGDIAGTNASGQDTGSFRPYDVAVTLGFATYISGLNKYPEERFVLGAGAKIVSSKITQRDSTIAADAGLLTPYMFDNKFRLSLTVSNMMGSLRYYQESFPLPLTLRAGSRALIAKSWDFTADLVAVQDSYPFIAMGTEIRAQIGKTTRLALRGGFNTRSVSDYEGFRNVSMGLGLGGSFLTVDYAFTPFGDLGNAQRLSCSLSF